MNNVEWTIAEMLNHPDILEKATNELNMVVGKDRLVQESDIPQLTTSKLVAENLSDFTQLMRSCLLMEPQKTQLSLVISSPKVTTTTTIAEKKKHFSRRCHECMDRK